MVVSTNVGGVVEVLPEDMVLLSNPNPEDIVKNIVKAIPIAKNI